jgi:cell division protein FtsB
MAFHPEEPLSRQLTIVIGLTVVGFMAFGLALSFYRNVLFDQTLSTMRLQNRTMAQRNEDARRELEYLDSAQHKDKYAKENLGRIRPDEKVLIITPPAVTPTYGEELTGTAKEQQEERFLELLRQMPVFEHWQLFLFHPEKVEELKRGI